MTIAFEWERIREKQPLIHQITNYVTVNDCANITLACGASPVMADAKEEVAEMAGQSQAVVLNIGTLNPPLIEAMLEAGQAANQKQVPVVLDPVGAGATKLRLQSLQKLLEQIHFAIIRGNASEISTLIGIREGRGVDATGTDIERLKPRLRVWAKERNTVIAVSGAVDYVTDGVYEAHIANGTPLLTRVTGTGCMTTAVMGCCVGAGLTPFSSAVTSFVAMGLVGEWAEASVKPQAVGSFRQRLLDGFAQMSSKWLQEKGRVQVAQIG